MQVELTLCVNNLAWRNVELMTSVIMVNFKSELIVLS